MGKIIELKKVKKFFLYEIDTYKIIFIDGVYSPFLSDTTHDGLDVCLMSAALSKFKYRKNQLFLINVMQYLPENYNLILSGPTDELLDENLLSNKI